MKIGYSLLLSEYINSELIEYDDCKNFQIICPSCKEPVFKVIRETEEKPIHYLSHYEKDKAYMDECELRISSIPQNEIQRNNNSSRNQRLQYFLSVLKETIYKTEYSDYEHAKKRIKQIEKSKALDKYRKLRYEHAIKMLSKNNEKDLLEFFENYVDEMKEIGGEFYKTTFSIEQQKQIALDIWYHILTPNAKENYFFLLNHSYVFFLSRIQKASKVRKLLDWEVYLSNLMNKIPFTSREKGYKLFQSLGLYKIPQKYSWSADNLYDKMSAEITYEMFGCLLRLPYFELLKEAIIKKNIISQIKANT